MNFLNNWNDFVQILNDIGVYIELYLCLNYKTTLRE